MAIKSGSKKKSSKTKSRAKTKTAKKPSTKFEKIKKTLSSEKNLKTAKNIATFATAAASVISLLKTTGVFDKITGNQKQEKTINEILTRPQQPAEVIFQAPPEVTRESVSSPTSFYTASPGDLPAQQQAWMPPLPWEQRNQNQQQAPQQTQIEPEKKKSFWSWD